MKTPPAKPQAASDKHRETLQFAGRLAAARETVARVRLDPDARHVLVLVKPVVRDVAALAAHHLRLLRQRLRRLQDHAAAQSDAEVPAIRMVRVLLEGDALAD